MPESHHPSFDADQASLLLLGDDAEIRQALDLIHRGCAERLCTQLERKYPWMDHLRVGACWNDTLRGVYKIAKDGRFDPERKLDGLLWKILSARAVDAVRSAEGRRQGTAHLPDDVAATDLGWHWKLATRAEQSEDMEVIRQIIDGLPTRRKVVIKAYMAAQVEGLPNPVQEARKHASMALGETLSMAAVKGVIREVRKAIKNKLNQQLKR